MILQFNISSFPNIWFPLRIYLTHKYFSWFEVWWIYCCTNIFCSKVGTTSGRKLRRGPEMELRRVERGQWRCPQYNFPIASIVFRIFAFYALYFCSTQGAEVNFPIIAVVMVKICLESTRIILKLQSLNHFRTWL